MSVAGDSLSGLIGDIPDLSGALCVGRSEWFDAPEPGTDRELIDYRRYRALALCAQCPVLTDCGTWVDSLRRSKRPHGIIAGRLPQDFERQTA